MTKAMEVNMSAFDDAPREVTGLMAQRQGGAGRTHPMIVVAAGAVTLFAVVGIGVLTGLIPSAYSSSQNRTATPGVLPTVAGAAQAPIGTNTDVAPLASEPNKTLQTPAARPEKASPPVAPVQPRNNTAPQTPSAAAAPAAPATTSAAAPVPRYEQPSSARERSVNTSSTTGTSSSANAPSNGRTISTLPEASTSSASSGGNGVVISTNTAQTGYVVSTKTEPLSCANCGTVDSINKVAEAGQGSGVGAVIGGVVGGAIGRQMGNGRGRDVATVAGAVAGGLIGNQVEKSGKSTAHYEVRVKLEDGSYQTVRYDVEPAVRVGDRVRIERGRVERIN
jgi:outer membrane lipoprotein SlyB